MTANYEIKSKRNNFWMGFEDYMDAFRYAKNLRCHYGDSNITVRCVNGETVLDDILDLNEKN